MTTQTSLEKKNNGNKTVAAIDESIMSSIVINGDLSKLNAQQKVSYYRQFCERLGLDPLTQPFKLLRLSGKETLYCDRSGTAQLNKLHSVSHEIKSRETVSGCYVVTAQASVPGGRHTESIGAVTIDNLKGDALCNAMMKAETKAKRRATLDLLGLGILDETEIETIRNVQTAPAPSVEAGGMHPNKSPFHKKYQTAAEVESILNEASDIKDIANLYYINTEIVEANPDLKAMFGSRKNEFYNATNITQPAQPPVQQATTVNENEEAF